MHTSRGRTALSLFTIAGTLALVVSVAGSPGDVLGRQRPRWHDFNGDGFGDLAIGIPDKNVGGFAGAGAVLVLYGSENGLTAANRQLFNESVSTLAGTPIAGATTGDHFGAALASGDFDGDGFADLAIGAPGRDARNPTVTDSGAIAILWGSPSGLGGAVEERTGQFPSDHLGSALVALDFFHGADGSLTPDGIADLAMTAANDPRALVVAGGSRTLLRNVIQQCVHSLGSSTSFVLAAGNVSAGALEELLVGLPNEPANDSHGVSVDGAGKMELIDRVAGVGACHGSLVSQATYGGSNAIGDHFGSAIVTGHFSRGSTPRESIAVGIPGKDVNAGGRVVDKAGAVMTIVKGVASVVSEASAGVPGDPHADEAFGSALAVGRFDAGTTVDLAIGIPGVTFDGFSRAGAVVILRNGAGLANPLITQDTTDVAGHASSHDRFGSTLSAANYGIGPRTDLAIGAPDDDEPSDVIDAGAVNVLYGTANGPTGTNSQLWSLDSTDVPSAAGPSEHFGATLH